MYVLKIGDRYLGADGVIVNQQSEALRFTDDRVQSIKESFIIVSVPGTTGEARFVHLRPRSPYTSPF